MQQAMTEAIATGGGSRRSRHRTPFSSLSFFLSCFSFSLSLFSGQKRAFFSFPFGRKKRTLYIILGDIQVLTDIFNMLAKINQYYGDIS